MSVAGPLRPTPRSSCVSAPGAPLANPPQELTNDFKEVNTRLSTIEGKLNK